MASPSSRRLWPAALALAVGCAQILGIEAGVEPDPAEGGANPSGGSGAEGPGGGGSGGAGGDVSPVAPLTVVSSLQLGGNDDEHLGGIAVDAVGRYCLVGSHSGPFALGSLVLSSTNTADVFAAKVSPEGDAAWAYSWGDGGEQYGLAVTQRTETNERMTYITGMFNGAMVFDTPNTPTVLLVDGSNALDGFVARIGDETGPNAAYAFSGPSNQSPAPITTAPVAQQNLLITGATLGNMGIASGTVEASGDARGFLARIFVNNPNTNVLVPFGTAVSASQHGLGIDADGNNRVAVVGWFTGTFDIDGHTALNLGGLDAFVAVLSMGTDSATPAWVQQIGGLGEEIAGAVAIASNGDVLVAGSISSDVVVHDVALALSDDNNPDLFVVRYLADGSSLVWGRSFRTTGLSKLALLVSGDRLYLSGNVKGSVELDRELVSEETDVLVAVLDATTGEPLASRLLGDPPGAPPAGDQMLAGMAKSPNGNVVVAGSFDGGLQLDDITLMSAGLKDIFVVELAP